MSELPWERAVDAQWQALSRFGPVTTHRLDGWDTALELIQPLRTFPRHYLVASMGDWCLVMCDIIGECCLVDVLFHSRLHGCRAVGGIALPRERRFFYIAQGEKVRDVHCFYEDRWFFRESGEPLQVECCDSYARRRVSERLSEQLVFAYLSEITGATFPLQLADEPLQIVALERSWHELEVTPEDHS